MNPSNMPIHQATHLSREDERRLVARLQGGDERAYEILVREYGGRMLAIAQRYLPCGQDSDDAVQEAFICAFKAIKSFESGSQLSTWLHRIVVNACLMKLRAQGRRSTVPIDALTPQYGDTVGGAPAIPAWDDTYANVALAETQSHVRGCIENLPRSYRQVLILRDLEEYDTRETARLLNTTPGNIKTRLHRARQILREMLEPLFVAPGGLPAIV